MITDNIQIRVRYGETDKMGVVYYGNYSLYLEVARTELMRKIGLSYKSLEDIGIQLPVIHLESNYIKPSYYDEIITIKTTLNEVKGSRLTFDYELFNSNNEIINKSSTTLIFVNATTGKPCRPPKIFFEKLK